ncbi:MAG: cytochrome c3 family protein [bacterium]
MCDYFLEMKLINSRTYLWALAVVALVTTAAGAVDLSKCEMCHKEGGRLPPIPAAFYSSSHGGLVCLDCHTDAMKPHSKNAPAMLGCIECHEEQGRALAASAHKPGIDGAPGCRSCHGSGHYVASLGLKSYQPSYTRAVCGKCHPQETTEYLNSSHGKASLKPGTVAPTCYICHGEPHGISDVESSSEFSFENLSELCGACHAGSEKTPHAPHPVPYPMVFMEKNGPNNRGKELPQLRATCVDCHTAHNEQPSAEPSSTVNIYNVAKTCGGCHAREYQLYSMSVHGMAAAGGVGEAPTCPDCHAAYDGAKPAALSGEERTALCAECHDASFISEFGIDRDKVDQYKHTFHAKAIHYGLTSAADCVDCHTPHGVFPPEDDRSTVSEVNLLDTCAAESCHPEAKGTMFAGAGGHLKDRGERADPVQKGTSLFFIWLTRTIIALLVLHILAEFTRDLPARLRASKNRERARK